MKAQLILPMLCGMASTASATEKPQNVVIILTDDLGFSDIGCFGGEIETPNLDKMAEQGIKMTQLYNSARSCPSRACLLTGLYPHQVGVGGMANAKIAIDPKKPVGYAGFRTDNNVTIAELMKKAGYYTAMSGKWHLGVQKPTERGFDDYYGLLGGFNSFWSTKPYSRLPEGAPELKSEGTFYATNVITDYAIDFARKAHEQQKPLFLYLAYNAPHFPLHAPKERIDKYMKTYLQGWDKLRDERFKRIVRSGLLQGTPELSPRGEVPGSAFVKEPHALPAWDSLTPEQQKDLARRMAVFAAMVDIVDENIGRFMKELKRLGELDNTIIMFMSDNGACAEWHEFGFDKKTGVEYHTHTGDELDNMGQPGTYHHYGTGWANLGCTPFTLYKHYAHEGGISTPCILWKGGKNKAKGTINHTPCHFTDIMSTCLDIAGSTYPETYKGRKLEKADGVSLLPAFEKKPIKQRVIYAEHEGNRMVRDGKWKLVSAQYKGNDWELYDIETDRTEQHNLATQHPGLVEKMSKMYAKWAKKCHVGREAQELPRNKATHILPDTWMRDPYIVIGPDELYYLTYTNGKMEMPVWKSSNLSNWEKIGEAYSMNRLSFYDEIQEKGKAVKKEEPVKLWAPELYYLNDRWCAVHTSSYRASAIITSETIDFKTFEEPMGNNFGHHHDPSLFKDTDGTIWLVDRCAEITKLKPDLSGFAGKPLKINPANRKMGHEGCQIIKVGNKYVLFGTAWSRDSLHKGTYNLYYATADKIEGPYSDRRFAGRCLGHGTVFRDKKGQWWCTAFLNGKYIAPEELVKGVDAGTASSMNQQGLTLVPMSIEAVNGDVVVRALDPHYCLPGTEEMQQFTITQ